MQRFLQLCLIWLLAMALGGHAAIALEGERFDTGTAHGQIVSSHDVITPGQSFHIAVSVDMPPDWHIYWHNPGDSGEPFAASFDAQGKASIGEIIWPLPKTVATGPIINYGFEGAPLFPVPVKVSENAKLGEVLTVSGSASYLVCNTLCIPEYFDFSLDVPIGQTAITDNRWSGNIARAIKTAPKPEPLKASARMEGGLLTIDVLTPRVLRNTKIRKVYFFPEDPSINLPSAPQTAAIGTDGLRLTLTPGYGLEAGLKEPVTGVLSYESQISGRWKTSGRIITAAPGPALAIGVADAPRAGAKSGAPMTLMAALISAFIGGLILNLMPCVFPVISIKALGFARHAHDKSAIRRQGWLYSAGVLATFMALTIALLALKAGGAQIGWGFQLQSPWLIAVLALMFFAIGLNLIGAFELGGRLSNVGNDLAAKGGNCGAFFTGALAVIVATPCTAPFMAGAIGFALSASAAVTIMIFTGLAIGFALPFLALSYAPKLLAKLPKPGPWMERCKEIFAFPMFAATAWLIWVISLQAGQAGLVKLLAALIGLGFVIWLLKRKGVFAKILAALFAVAVIAAPFTIKSAPQALAQIETDAAYETGKWSAARVTQLHAEGRPIFVDFTAAWCVTCKVNEIGALRSKRVEAALEDSHTVMLIADWTNRDAVIAAELAKHGRSGVPLYLYYPAGGNIDAPQILPQILTEKYLVELLTAP